jgi:DegV family protein with EDD domain
MPVAIVTDSTCDIPESLAEQYDIHIIPNIVVIDGQELEDRKDISRQEFYERLPDMKRLPTTATASAGAYQELYEKLLNQGFENIISIHASSQLSGICNAANAAAQGLGERVRVIDSQNVTLGLGFQVLAAAKLAASGSPPGVILKMLEDIRPRARVIAMLDTLEYLRRSGRVSWARARLGNLLRIKPFVAVKSGGVVSLGETRTRRKGIERLHEFLNAQGTFEQLAILHTNAEQDAQQFIAELAFELAAKPLVVNVTTVIGTHVGPNGLGFAALVR